MQLLWETFINVQGTCSYVIQQRYKAHQAMGEAWRHAQDSGACRLSHTKNFAKKCKISCQTSCTPKNETLHWSTREQVFVRIVIIEHFQQKMKQASKKWYHNHQNDSKDSSSSSCEDTVQLQESSCTSKNACRCGISPNTSSQQKMEKGLEYGQK